MPRGSRHPEEIKQKAVELRRKGLTYTEIQSLLNHQIPKNTFTGWFKNIPLSEEAKTRIIDKIRKGGAPGRAIAWRNTQMKRKNLVDSINNKVDNEIKDLDKSSAKVALAMLYMCEGGKTGGFVRFGNSDPRMIELFLRLLRGFFEVNEQKFRGRVQCRADQNITELEKFWSVKSNIPLSLFRKAQVDRRTIGKPIRRLDYKGVLVIDYYSTALFLELKSIFDIIYKRSNLGPVVYR